MSTELNTKHPLRGLALALLAFALGGCVVAPSDPYYYGEETILVTPPARVEYRGYPPAAGYLWIDGYWTQLGPRHHWVPGRWAPPRYRTTEIVRERTIDHRRDHGWDGDRDRSRGHDGRRNWDGDGRRDGGRDRDRSRDHDRDWGRPQAAQPRTLPQPAPQVVPQPRTRDRVQAPGMDQVRDGSGDRSRRGDDAVRTRGGSDDGGGRRAERGRQHQSDEDSRRGGERRGGDRRGDERRGDDRR